MKEHPGENTGSFPKHSGAHWNNHSQNFLNSDSQVTMDLGCHGVIGVAVTRESSKLGVQGRQRNSQLLVKQVTGNLIYNGLNKSFPHITKSPETEGLVGQRWHVGTRRLFLSSLPSWAGWLSPRTGHSAATRISIPHNKKGRGGRQAAMSPFVKRTQGFSNRATQQTSAWISLTGTGSHAPRPWLQGGCGSGEEDFCTCPKLNPIRKKFPLLLPPFSKQIFCNTPLSREAMNRSHNWSRSIILEKCPKCDIKIRNKRKVIYKKMFAFQCIIASVGLH